MPPKPIPKPRNHPMRRRQIFLEKPNDTTPIKRVEDITPTTQGRISKYNEATFPAVAFYTVFTGGTHEDVAKKLGVNPGTVTEWKKKHPEFAKAINAQMDHILGDTVSALIKRALGYVVEDQETSLKQHVNKNTGEVIQTKDIKIIRRHVNPDVGAIICLLANRDPQKWRRTDSPLIDLRDKSGARVASEIPTEHLEEIIRTTESNTPTITTPCYTNWDALGTEEEFALKLRNLIPHDTDEPS